jgi:hypothetical protein
MIMVFSSDLFSGKAAHFGAGYLKQFFQAFVHVLPLSITNMWLLYILYLELSRVFLLIQLISVIRFITRLNYKWCQTNIENQ